MNIGCLRPPAGLCRYHGGLACSVWPEKGEQLAGRDRQREIGDGDFLAVGDRMIYFPVFFVRFPDTAFAVFFRATDLLAGVFVKCSLTLAAS
jgi:hypothetical protein